MDFLLLTRDYTIAFQVLGGLLSISALVAHSQFRSAFSCAAFAGAGMAIGLLPVFATAI